MIKKWLKHRDWQLSSALDWVGGILAPWLRCSFAADADLERFGFILKGSANLQINQFFIIYVINLFYSFTPIRC